MANVPQELINEILILLPVKSLLRFRCVSKSCCEIIESQAFIRSHFEICSRNRIHCKLIDLGIHSTNYRPKIHAVEFDDDYQQKLLLVKKIPCKLYSLFYSCCNGLVLLCLLPYKLSLWNPSTRQYRVLPAFPVKKPDNYSFALGYDSITDDYKVIVIVSRKGWDSFQVWIFDLSLSCWRRIRDFPYIDYNRIEDGGNGDCFVDGALHFLCHDREDFESYIIVSFDVAKETFSRVLEPVCHTEVTPTRLQVYGECLTITICGLGGEPEVDIYVRKKERDEFVWTKLFSVAENQFSEEAFECFADGRLAFSKEGDKVFLSSNGKLCSYDYKEKNLQEIVSKSTSHIDIFVCVESLVSVGTRE